MENRAMIKCTCDANQIKQATRHYESGLISREELSVKIKEIKLERNHEKELIKLRDRQNQQWWKLKDKHTAQLNNLIKEQD